jgi:hypothetical protein
LCIIQNSDADKSEEIDRMGQIYKKATVTIAAAPAKSVSKGFLQICAAPEHHTLPFLTPGGSLGKVFVMRELAHDSMHPLNKRGWTLQECSPRESCCTAKENWYGIASLSNASNSQGVLSDVLHVRYPSF